MIWSFIYILEVPGYRFLHEDSVRQDFFIILCDHFELSDHRVVRSNHEHSVGGFIELLHITFSQEASKLAYIEPPIELLGNG